MMKGAFAVADSSEHLVRLVRIARSLEAVGFYNAAKLFWALNDSAQIRATNEHGVPLPADALDREMEAAITELVTAGARPDLITMLKRGQRAAGENRTIRAGEISQAFVCRTCGEIALGQPPERCPVCDARALTFREHLPVYYLEPLHPEQAVAALASGPSEVAVAVEGLSEEDMARAPRAGEWAVRDVLHHLLVTQELLSARVEKMLAEENPLLIGVAAWTAGPDRPLSARDMLEHHRTSRQDTVRRLQNLPAQEWWRTAQHEEFGQVTVLQQASYFAKHERAHLPQIGAIRGAIGA
jgi:uncharacterized damage-inducible protein DinB